MSVKLLTSAELLAMAAAAKKAAAQSPIKTALNTYAQGAGIVNPTPTVGTGEWSAEALNAAVAALGGTPVSVPAATTTPVIAPAPAYEAPAYTAPAYTPINVAPPAYKAPDTTAPAYTAPAYKDVAIPTPAYTNPAGGPLMDAANAAFAEYQKSATGAANNELDAQMAQANSIINSGGTWKALQPIADKQMQDSMAALMQISVVAKANVEASKAALDTQEAADYQEIIDVLDKNLDGARKRTTEDMNGRGLFFSTVLDSVMGQVEAASTTEKGHAAAQSKARYAKIASDMAVMTGNIDIEVLKGNASAVAQYTAQMLQVVAQDEQTKQEMAALVAKLSVQKMGVIDAVAAQVFATGQQMQATAFGQQSQLNADAANAANTKFSQQTQLSEQAFNQQAQQNTDAMNAAITKFSQQAQINLDAANAQATAFNQQGQLSDRAFNQQVQQNADAANAAVAKFSQQEQVKLDAANAQITTFNQQAQLRGEAANATQQAYANKTEAANTAFTQNLQTNAASNDATAAAQQQFVNTMGQYAGDYQAAINNLDPSDPLYTFKSGMLAADRQTKLVGVAAQTKTDFLNTINQYAIDFQAQINKVANDGNTTNDWQLPYLKIAKMQKVSDQLVAQAEYDATKAKADALVAYQNKQLDLQWFNATTQRINASGSASGTSKAYALSGGGGAGGSGGAGGTAKAAPNVWTHPAALAFKLAYDKVVNMPVGTTVDASIAQDPNIVGSGVTLNIGDTWTEQSKAAYIAANKGLYDSAMNALNVSDIWSPNNPKFSPPFKAMLQGMINQGIQINEANIGSQILAQADEPSGKPGLSGQTGGAMGAEYDALMAEFIRNK